MKIFLTAGCSRNFFDNSTKEIFLRLEFCFPRLKSLDGIELLIHIGVDTVEMNGKGFQTFVKVGDTVSLGQKLIAFSREEIRKAGYIDAVAMIITRKFVQESHCPSFVDNGFSFLYGNCIIK